MGKGKGQGQQQGETGGSGPPAQQQQGGPAQQQQQRGPRGPPQQQQQGGPGQQQEQRGPRGPPQQQRGPRGPWQQGGPGQGEYSSSQDHPQMQQQQRGPRGPPQQQQQGGPGQQQEQRGPRGPPQQQRGPRGPWQQGGPGQGEYSSSQDHPQMQQQQRGPRGPQQQGRPSQGEYSYSQGYTGTRHQQGRQGPRGPRQGQEYHQGPRAERGPDTREYHQFQDQGYQQSQRPQPQHQFPPIQGLCFERSTTSQQPGPTLGPKPEPPAQGPPGQQPGPAWPKKPEPPAVQSAPAQPTIAAPAEQKPKGRGRGRGQPLQEAVATPTPPVPTAAQPTQEKAQPTPAEAKPGGQKKKGKSREAQKPAAPVTTTPTTAGVEDIDKKIEKLKLSQPTTLISLPKRKQKEIKHDGPHVLKKFIIEVNYLPLKIKDPKLQIFHYDVNFNPDRPKYLLRKALEEMRRRHFSDRHPAFDGMKNMYLAGRPLNANDVTIRDTVTVLNEETGRDKEFDVTIKLVNGNLNLFSIFQYCEGGVTSNIPQTEIQATDIALRSGLSNHFTPAGRSFFARSDNPQILGGGFELWHGFYQSAVAAWKPYLNIDVANKAFPIEQRVLQFMCEEFRCRENDFVNGLENNMKYRLEKFIKGLKISYDMPTQGGPVQRRIYKVTGLGGTPIEEKFQPNDDGPAISVGMYYQREKRYNIKFPRLPLLKIGTKGSMVPIELCSIVGDQAVMRKLDEFQTANMVRAAARPTTERKERIDTNIRRANYANNPTLREFGIEVQTSFEKVEAVVIKPPNLAYAQNTVPVRDGVWRLDNDKFLRPSVIPEWAVLNLNSRTPPGKIQDLERLIVNVGKNLGMNVPRPQPCVTHQRLLRENDIDDYLIKFSKNNVKLVIVVLSNGDDIYGQVKRASELRTGVLTQCIKGRTLERINPMTVTNILLKVNAKLKGVNHSIAPPFKPNILNVPCMLVGADVTHPAPGPGAEGTPSIAGVAASSDVFGFQYKMLYRLQPSREEMIIDLADIMKEQIQFFIKTNNREPQRIVYFRDGVSEGQFQQVLNVELMAIRRACSMINPNYEPAITFLVVQKRHHTRFFPNQRDGDRKNCNVPAGTLVDKQITHPTEVDFYLVSHQSIQGTARPTKYHLLWDDLDIPQIELEKLTYYLCHMFARCTRSVSYPAPTYYAHLAAFRARAWWDRWGPNMAQLKKEQEGRGKICQNILDNYPMFFT